MTQPVIVQTTDERVWHSALWLADGNPRRIQRLSHDAVLVLNHER